MRVVFRVDASAQIGSGHVVRCLTLADALRKEGTEVLFVCRTHEGHLGSLIAERGFDVKMLARIADTISNSHEAVYAAWLGAAPASDAAQTMAVIRATEEPVDWLIVDHYAVDETWERALRPYVRHIMVIDDLADRRHDCDLLLDQNLVSDMEDRYKGLVSEKCKTLLGPRYALLQDEYEHLHKTTQPRQSINRLLIYFGGVDSENLTTKSVRTVLSMTEWNPQIDIVLSYSNPQMKKIEALLQANNNIYLHHNLKSLAPLIASSDLAIGAVGATSWERLCLGLPTIGVTTAQNQVEIAKELDRSGYIKWIGHAQQIDETTIMQVLSAVLSSDDTQAWSSKCMTVCDGSGTRQVSAFLL